MASRSAPIPAGHAISFASSMNNDPQFGLDRLIDPVLSSVFFEQHWEEEPLLVKRAAPDYYARLLSLTQIDALLAEGNLPASAIDVVNADAPVERGEFVRSDGTVDILKVYRLFSDGASVLFHELQKWVPALASLCREMEARFSSPFQTNVYMTPGRGQGFRAHYDTHDVFLLQIAGTKEWNVSQVPMRLPLRGQPFDSTVHTSGVPIMSCEVHAGDLLYLPRGFVHEARSCDATSLHVTLGALSYTWADVLLDVMSDVCLTDAAFRRALPLDFARPGFDMAAARGMFDALLRRAAANADVEATLERFADELVATRAPLVPGQLAQMSRLSELAPHDEAGARPGLLYRMREDAASVRVRCHGREVSFPLQAASAVKYALETSRYAIHDLPGELDDAGKLVLVRSLIADGMVVRYPGAAVD